MVTAFDRLAKVGPRGWSKEGFYSLSLWHSPRSETLGRVNTAPDWPRIEDQK